MKKISVLAILIIFLVCMCGCTQNSPTTSNSEVITQVPTTLTSYQTPNPTTIIPTISNNPTVTIVPSKYPHFSSVDQIEGKWGSYFNKYKILITIENNGGQRVYFDLTSFDPDYIGAHISGKITPITPKQFQMSFFSDNSLTAEQNGEIIRLSKFTWEYDETTGDLVADKDDRFSYIRNDDPLPKYKPFYSSRWGFQMEYPTEWYFKRGKNSYEQSMYEFNTYPSGEIDFSKSMGSFMVNAYACELDITEDLIALHMNDLDNQNVDISKIAIDGNSATKAIVTTKSGSISTWIYVYHTNSSSLKPGPCYILQHTSFGDTLTESGENYDEIFNRMIKSFNIF